MVCRSIMLSILSSCRRVGPGLVVDLSICRFGVVGGCCCTPELVLAASREPLQAADLATENLHVINRRRGRGRPFPKSHKRIKCIPLTILYTQSNIDFYVFYADALELQCSVCSLSRIMPCAICTAFSTIRMAISRTCIILVFQ